MFSGGAAPPEPQSLRSRKRSEGTSGKTVQVSLHQHEVKVTGPEHVQILVQVGSGFIVCFFTMQDTGEKNIAVVMTTQCPQCPLQEQNCLTGSAGVKGSGPALQGTAVTDGNSHPDIQAFPLNSEGDLNGGAAQEMLLQEQLGDLTRSHESRGCLAPGLPGRKKRRMGMCGLTEKERSLFLQTLKSGAESQEEPSSPQREAGIQPPPSLCGCEDGSGAEVCFTDGTRAEGRSCEELRSKPAPGESPEAAGRSPDTKEEVTGGPSSTDSGSGRRDAAVAPGEEDEEEQLCGSPVSLCWRWIIENV